MEDIDPNDTEALKADIIRSLRLLATPIDFEGRGRDGVLAPAAGG